MPKGQLIIREARETDIDPIRDINNSIGENRRSATYQDRVSSYTGGDLAASCVAELDGKIVGFVLGRLWSGGFLEEERDVWLDMIGVYEEYRTRGIGSRLIEAFVDMCRRRGAQSARVIITSGDEHLQAFLERRGFIVGDMVHLQRKLGH